MAESIISFIETVSGKVPDLPINNGQLIFIPDSRTIALDLKDRRTFFNQIVTLTSESERKSILAPVNGSYYFVLQTAVLWHYQDQWIQITTPPEEIVFIGIDFPQTGSSKTLYVNTENKNISVWDEDSQSYQIVGEATRPIQESEIKSLFN